MDELLVAFPLTLLKLHGKCRFNYVDHISAVDQSFLQHGSQQPHIAQRNLKSFFFYHKLNWFLTNISFQLNRILSNNTSIVKIRAGSSSHVKDGELLSVKRIVQNTKFNGNTIDFDFSLLELEEPIQFDETKQAIKLHNFDEVFPDNTTTLVSGWGNTQNSSESRLQLRGGEN